MIKRNLLQNKELRHQNVAIEKVSKHLVLAVIASEDQNFLQHAGLDVAAIRKAVEHNKKGRRKRGASTLTQQVAKNVWLWEGRSWVRKALEAPLTLSIELTWGKRRILEVYLNVAEWGPGVFGIEAASRHWFGKPASRLSRQEACLLAATLPSPNRYNPRKPSPGLLRRANWISQQIDFMNQREILGVVGE